MNSKTCREITFEISEKTLSKLPDMAQAKWFQDYLGVSHHTLKRYREVAYLIPDYLKICDRIWLETTGNNFEINQIRARMQGQTIAIDQPPFYRPQMQVLTAIPRLLEKHQGKYQKLATHIKKNPKDWRKYHAS